jgi:hypothetical protein
VKRPIFLLNAKGKSKAQLKAEARQAFREYLQAQQPPRSTGGESA